MQRIILIISLMFSPPAFAEEVESLVFVFQKQKNPAELKSASERVGEFLEAELGQPVRVRVPSDYSASVQGLVSKKVDFAYTSSLPFLLARRDGGASLLLAEQREDIKGKIRTDYDALLVVREGSGLKSLADLKSRAKNLRIAFTSPTSTSGYVFAYKRFIDEGILQAKQDPKKVFKSVRFAGSYTQALEEVLAGRADVAAVSYYTLEGPKAGVYLSKEKLAKLRILARTPGVPTHVITARAGLEQSIKAKVKTALLKLAKDRPELLEDVYGTASFKEVDEVSHVEKTVSAVEYIGLPVDKLM